MMILIGVPWKHTGWIYELWWAIHELQDLFRMRFFLELCVLSSHIVAYPYPSSLEGTPYQVSGAPSLCSVLISGTQSLVLVPPFPSWVSVNASLLGSPTLNSNQQLSTGYMLGTHWMHLVSLPFLSNHRPLSHWYFCQFLVIQGVCGVMDYGSIYIIITSWLEV